MHVEGAHPVDVPFLFEQPAKRIAPAALASFISHVFIVVAVVLFIRYAPHPVSTAALLKPVALVGPRPSLPRVCTRKSKI